MESGEIAVVQQSASVNNAFISTVDHLPCDVIRSLWLIQSCNIASSNSHHELNKIITRIQRSPLSSKNDNTVLSDMRAQKARIKYLDSEALQESKALFNQLLMHKAALIDELSQLESIQVKEVITTQDNDIEGAAKLKAALLEHYKENPLTSQLEAIKEHEKEVEMEKLEEQENLRKQQNRIKSKNLRKRADDRSHRRADASGKIKLVFKIQRPSNGGTAGGSAAIFGGAKKVETRGRPRKYPVEFTGKMVNGVKVIPKMPKAVAEKLQREWLGKQQAGGTELDKEAFFKAFSEKADSIKDISRRTELVSTTQKHLKEKSAATMKSTGRHTPTSSEKSAAKLALAEKAEKAAEEAEAAEAAVEKAAQLAEDKATYCFCKQGSFGNMIGCDNEDSCPNGDWFHYKCVGLLNKFEALKYSTGKAKWYCSDGCRQAGEEKQKRKLKKKKRRW